MSRGKCAGVTAEGNASRIIERACGLVVIRVLVL